MVKHFGSICFVGLCVTVLSWQTENIFKRIVVSEYPGATILPTKKSNEKFQVELDDSKFLQIQTLDYRGAMKVKCFTNDSILIEEGQYINSLDLLKKYSIGWGGASVGKKTSVVRVIEYYSPLRNGSWKFYENRLLVKTIIYNRGIAIDSSFASNRTNLMSN